MADTFGEHFKNQALIDVDPATFETLELPHEASTWPLSFHDDLEQLANKCPPWPALGWGLVPCYDAMEKIMAIYGNITSYNII